ncbi:hypothetical protein V6N12_074139 [Hibiscus sabdariffa]|uniref:Uncharacterized protein n=1 Tax=Hibiscus sabdariffa TaxID=183260 RepID=A0ABR2BFY9_9ROSI
MDLFYDLFLPKSQMICMTQMDLYLQERLFCHCLNGISSMVHHLKGHQTGDSSTFGFPSVRHGYFLPFSSFKEPDDLYDPTGSLPGREPQFQLLECDSINKNRRSSSSTYQNTNWTVVPALQRSWDHQQSLNIPFSSFKNLDDSHDPVGSSPGRDSHLPLLEWHSVEVNGRSLSATCPNSNWTLIPAVQSSWNHQRNQNNWCESFDCIHYETACQGSETSSSLPSPENHLGFMRNALVEENQTPGFGNQFSLALNLPWKSYNQVV